MRADYSCCLVWNQRTDCRQKKNALKKQLSGLAMIQYSINDPVKIRSGCVRNVYSMENAKENFKQVLYAVIETYGTEILDDSRRINAFLMDYAPGQARERKLIV